MDSNFSLNNGSISYDVKTGNDKNETVSSKNPYSAKLNSCGLKKDTVSFTSKKQENKTFIDKVKNIFKKDENGKMSGDGKAAIACTVLGIGAAAGLYLLSHGKKQVSSLPTPKGKINDIVPQTPAPKIKPDVPKAHPGVSKGKSKTSIGHPAAPAPIVHKGEASAPALQPASAPIPVVKAVPETQSAPLPILQSGNREVYDFSRNPWIKPMDNAKLDAEAQNILDAVTLDKVFNDSITNEADLRKVLASAFPQFDSEDVNRVIACYNKDANIAELLRYISEPNLKVKIDSKHSIPSLFEYMNLEGAVIDVDAFKEFLKFKKNYSINPCFRPLSLAREYKNYVKNPEDAKRLFVYADLAEKQIRDPDPYSMVKVIDVFRMLEQDNHNPKDVIEFLSALNEGNMHSGNLGCLLSLKPNFDPKTAAKFLNSLKKEAMEKVGAKTIENVGVKNINGKEFSKKLNALSPDVLAKFNHDSDILNFDKFPYLFEVDDINALTITQKKDLFSKLVKMNVCELENNDWSRMFRLVPTGEESYCSLLQKLTRSIGIDTKPLTEAEQKAFEAGLKSAASNISKANLDDVHFALDIPRQDFIQKARKAMENLDDIEKRRVMDYFGFELQDIAPSKSNGLRHTLHTMKGYPINVNNGAKLAEIESDETKKVIENVRKIVAEFSEDNGVKLVSKSGAALTSEQKALEADLNEIFKGLPELRSIIGRKQHKTHVFSLDEHTFRVFQGVTQNPKFEKLSDSDKKVVSLASLLHDITKAEGLRDAMHPTESAFDAFHITQKLNLSEDERVKVYELIKSHNWLDRMCAKTKDGTALPIQKVQELAQDVAFDARHTNTFDLAKILCEADMKAVKPNGTFFEKHKDSFNEMSAYVDKYLESIHSTQIILPQTRIPKASAIKNGIQKTADGVTNTVLYMDDIKSDMSKYGFKKGTTKENLRVLVHALVNKDQMSKFNTFSSIDSDALLSASYIDANNYKVFRNQGFVLDVDYNDIHAGYYKDFGTGCKKDIELLKSDYLFHGDRKSFDNRTKYRKYISNLIKKEMGITNDKEYANMVKQIQSAKSITEIKETNPKLADALDNVFSSMEAGERYGGRQYNEMLVSCPKIQGSFAYDEKYEDIPVFIRQYAQDNDIPILLFGDCK